MSNGPISGLLCVLGAFALKAFFSRKGAKDAKKTNELNRANGAEILFVKTPPQKRTKNVGFCPEISPFLRPK